MSKLIAKLKTGTLKGTTSGAFRLDDTLTKYGYAADSEAVGDRLAQTEKNVNDRINAFSKEFDDAVAELNTDSRVVNGVVEWFNPPMHEGVEYRLAERINGKPVYIKRIMPNFSESCLPTYEGTHDIKNMGEIVDIGGCLVSSYGADVTERQVVGLPHRVVGYSGAYYVNIWAQFTKTKLYIMSDGNLPSDYENNINLWTPYDSARVWVKYTKTTD